MPHRKLLTDVVERVLHDLGLSGAYAIDVYRAHALDDWRVTLRPTSRSVLPLELRFTIGPAPDWAAIAHDAKRQIESPTA